MFHKNRIYQAKKAALKKEIKETREGIKGIMNFLKEEERFVSRINSNAHANKANQEVYLMHTKSEAIKDINEMKAHLKELKREKRRLWFQNYFGFLAPKPKEKYERKKDNVEKHYL